MGLILTLIALLIIFLGVSMVLKPDGIPGMVKLYADEPGLQVFASVGRALFGIALMVYASHSNWPSLLTVLGALSLISGIVFMVLPAEKFSHFVRSMVHRVIEFGPVPGIVVTLIGAAILDAVF